MADPWIAYGAGVAPPVGHYSQARSVPLPTGALVFLAGQVAVDGRGQLVGPEDPSMQARQVYSNIAAILGAGGGSFADVVKLTTFATAAVPLADAVAARDAHLTTASPATTFTYVSALADPRFLLEVEAVAFVPTRRA